MFGWCFRTELKVSVRGVALLAAWVGFLDLALLSAEEPLMSVSVCSTGELLFAVPALVGGLAPVQVQVVFQAMQSVERLAAKLADKALGHYFPRRLPGPPQNFVVIA